MSERGRQATRGRVALLGCGAMGVRVGTRLIAAGHQLVVYNRTPERATPLAALGARVATSPADAARGAQFVVSMVRDVEASQAVWLAPGVGAAHVMEVGAVAVESSTLTPAWVGELGRTLGRRGIDLLDAPVVGSRPQAEAGELVYLIGGDPSVLATAASLLEAAGRIEYVGGVGEASALKLVVNGLYAAQVATMAELVPVLSRAGVDLSDAVEILRRLPVTSPALGAAVGAMVEGDFTPAFPIDLVAKDLAYLLALAERLGDEAPMAAVAAATYRRSVSAGDGKLNAPGVLRLFEP